MHRRSSKRQQLIRRISIYTLMTVSVLALVTVLVLVIRGYQYDTESGRLERTGLVQFGSTPGGARISINGRNISGRTPTKAAVRPGVHEFRVSRAGYRPWGKSISVDAGTIHWLNYIRLIPNDLNYERVLSYEQIDQSLAAPTNRAIVLVRDSTKPQLTWVDITGDELASRDINLPADSYVQPGRTKGHDFRLMRWDEGGRYVLLQHKFAGKVEWLVVDTNDAEVYNLNDEFDVAISEVYFSGRSGNVYYILSNNTVRKLDRSAGTISRTLIGDVESFSLSEPNILSYTTTYNKTNKKQSVGIYREGDKQPHILKTVAGAKQPLQIALASYLGENYAAIAVGKKLEVIKGNVWSDVDDSSNTTIIAEEDLAQLIKSLEFSPANTFVIAQTERKSYVYGIEHETFAESPLDDVSPASLRWLDEMYFWDITDGELSIREYDGSNVSKIGTAFENQTASLSPNGKSLYYFTADKNGVYLGRTKLVVD